MDAVATISPQLKVPERISRPSPAARPLSFASSPYVTHCRTPVGATSVVVASDDGRLSLIDKAQSTIISSTHWTEGGRATGLDVFPHGGWATSGQAGVAAVWDPRALWSPSTVLPNSRGGGYLSVAVQKQTGTCMAAGCELQSGEAAVDIFDLRHSAVPILSYTESHSDDVTTLAFHPRSGWEHLLLSGSSDGLAAVYDLTIGADEDDAVLAVGNTGASIARAGWGGAPAGVGQLFVKPGEEEDQLDGLEEHQKKPRRGLGGAWTVSDMQTVGIWDADRVCLPFFFFFCIVTGAGTDLPKTFLPYIGIVCRVCVPV